MRAIFLGYENLKCSKKLIELQDELEYLNIPVTFTAIYLVPQKFENLRKENKLNSSFKPLKFLKFYVKNFY